MTSGVILTKLEMKTGYNIILYYIYIYIYIYIYQVFRVVYAALHFKLMVISTSSDVGVLQKKQHLKFRVKCMRGLDCYVRG